MGKMPEAQNFLIPPRNFTFSHAKALVTKFELKLGRDRLRSTQGNNFNNLCITLIPKLHTKLQSHRLIGSGEGEDRLRLLMYMRLAAM